MKNLPKVRFQGFTDAWKKMTLSQILSPQLRPIPKPTEPYWRLGIRSHVRGTFHELVENPESVDMDTLYVVHDKDLIVNITFAWEHAITVAKKADEGKLVSHRFPTYVFNKSKANPDFYSHYIKRPIVKYKLSNASPGGAGRNRVLNKSEFLKIDVAVPSIAEQQKIASFFSLLDQRIEKQQEKIGNLEQFKKGILQRIFSQEIRFKDDNGQDFPNWDIELFDQIATKNSKKVNPQSKKNVPCIELENMIGNKGRVDGYFLSHEQQSTKNQFSIGAVLFGKLRPYLKKYWFATFDGVCSSEIWVLTPTDSRICNEYLYFIVQSEIFQQAANVSSGSKMPRTEWDSVRSLEIPLPSVSEQKKIASFLFTLEQKISKEEQKSELLKQMKAGLMQQMLI